MKTTLIITTYNRPDALRLVLFSILKQTVLPDQIIIADDGSNDATKEIINDFNSTSKLNVIHSWQEDIGFRAAMSRNKALSKAKNEYIIMIDGDIIMHKNFVEDHIKNAKHGCFLQGGRNLLTQPLTQKLLSQKDYFVHLKYAQKGIEQRLEKRLLSFRAPFLTCLFNKKLSYSLSGIRSCNMSFFYDDIVKVNGFNNNFIGWGREDSEFVARLFNRGVKRINLKFSALGYHLYHKEEPKNSLPQNDKLLNDSINFKLQSCPCGLNKFVNKMANQ